AYELLARFLGELLEAQLLDAAFGEQIGEEVLYLGTREREHQERLLGQRAERGVDELRAGEVAPVEIFEDEDDGLRGALCGEPIFERATHLIAHEDRIVSRRAELHVVLLRHRDAKGLGEELRDASALALGDMTR